MPFVCLWSDISRNKRCPLSQSGWLAGWQFYQ